MSLTRIVSTCALLCCVPLVQRGVQAQDVAGRAKVTGDAAVEVTLEGRVDTRARTLFSTEVTRSGAGTSKASRQPLAGAGTSKPPTGGPVNFPAARPDSVQSVMAISALDGEVESERTAGQVFWTQVGGRAGSVGCVGPGCFEEILQAHRSAIIAEFLYLNPRNTDVPYATPMDGIGPSAVPIGASSMSGAGYEPGFRLGLNWNRTDSSSLSAIYTNYRSHGSDSRTLPGGLGFLNADLVHPNTISVATDSLSAAASHDLDFEFIDVQYRTTISEKTYLVYLTAGVRYAEFDEDFRARYTMLGSTDVSSDIGFDGVGPRLGLEIERAMDGDLYMYLRGGASLMFGRFDADYLQSNIFSGTQAVVGLQDSRMVPITELELGFGWGNSTETFRFSAGYYVGSWFNTVTTGSFIDSVQDGTLYSIGGVGDTLVFDGLVARVEVRY